MSRVTFKEEGGTIATPPAGYLVFYAKTDGLLYFMDDTGTESAVKGGAALTDIDTLAKLNAVVTDATLVDTADIVLVAATSLASAGFFLDEDDLVSDSNTKVASQQSIKAYIASLIIDEDNMASDSAVHVPTQQSVKAYVDTAVSSIPSGDVVDDLTPQLGGNLDVNGHQITSAATVIVDGTGFVVKLGTVNTFLMNASGIYPSVTGTYPLGSTSLRWSVGWFDRISINEYFYWSDAYTVGSLPSAAVAGQIARVNDADTPVIGSVVTGGGASECIVYSNGTNWTVIAGGTMPSGGGGGLTPVFKSASYTAAANDLVSCLTLTAAATIPITLPAGSDTDHIAIWDFEDSAGDYNITITPNGAETIDGDTSFTINVSGGRVDLVYQASDTDWKVAYSTPGAASALTEADVDARVVAVASGLETRYFDVSKGEITTWTASAITNQAASANNTLPYDYIAFDGTTPEYAAIYWKPPKRWNAGTVRFRFVWKEVTGVSSGVFWAASGAALADGDDMATASGSSASIDDSAQGDAKKLLISGWTGACTLSNTPAKEDFIQFTILRNPNQAADTLNGVDARLLGVEIEYTTDAPTDD